MRALEPSGLGKLAKSLTQPLKRVKASAKLGLLAEGSLRASLDARKQNIKVVFAGSSEATLRRMFGRSAEPFYNWAPVEPFELLGADFVRAMVAKVNRLSTFCRRCLQYCTGA